MVEPRDIGDNMFEDANGKVFGDGIYDAIAAECEEYDFSQYDADDPETIAFYLANAPRFPCSLNGHRVDLPAPAVGKLLRHSDMAEGDIPFWRSILLFPEAPETS